MAIEDIMLRAIVGNALTRDLILAMKTAYFAQEFEGGLTVVDPSFGFENTTGLDRVNEWAKEEIIQPMREARWPDVTPGALLCGSTGLGKTWWASALAYEAGVPMVRLDPERMQSSLVGSTEARIAKMLGVIEANWPCILFVDEVDQSDIAARGNESGNPVAKNMFAMFLRWMGRPEIQGRIVVLMATNRPDLLDPAFVRRLGNVIPFVPYNEQGRAGVVRTQARIQGVGITDEAVTYLAAASRNYSGADLKLVVEKARKLARRAGHTGIELADAEQAFRVIRPVSLKPIDRNGTLAVNFYTTLALNAATDLSLVPDDSEWQDATAPETIVARLSTMDGAFRDTRDDWTVN
jgi:SpoVK/Ycf46/Vps4 family AAA+-type ATPase